MTTKPTVSTLKCKKLFTSPCKSITCLFKFKNPTFIRRNVSPKTKPTRTSTETHYFCCLTSFFRSLSRPKDMDRLMELKSFSDSGFVQKAPCPSPLTPAYVKMVRGAIAEDDDDAKDDCQRFESYLVKMVAEEGNTRDLVDVEELLYCWKNLKSPVFMNLVCRFYAELCKDLFSTNQDNDGDDNDYRIIKPDYAHLYSNLANYQKKKP